MLRNAKAREASPRSDAQRGMEYKEVQESINTLFASDEVDRQTALDSYQRVYSALGHDMEAQKVLNLSLGKVWMRRMVYLGKSLDERVKEGEGMGLLKEELGEMKLACDVKDREIEKYREASEQVWRESRREALEREDHDLQTKALKKSLSEANERADLYLGELLQLRKSMNKS